MYLTDKQSRIDGSERAEKDHEEIEMILESSQRQVEEIVNEVVTTIVGLLLSLATSEDWTLIGC